MSTWTLTILTYRQSVAWILMWLEDDKLNGTPSYVLYLSTLKVKLLFIIQDDMYVIQVTFVLFFQTLNIRVVQTWIMSIICH